MSKLIDNAAKRYIKKQLSQQTSSEKILVDLLEKDYESDDANYYIQTMQADFEDRKQINKDKPQYTGACILGFGMMSFGIYSLVSGSGIILIGLIIVGTGMFIKSVVELTR